MIDKPERIYLAYLTEPREVGESTPHSPQHLTLVPPFEPKPQIAIEAVRATKDFFRQFPVQVAEKTNFGPDQDIPVYIIRPKNILAALHNALMDELEQRGIDTAPLKFTRKNYQPHITIKPSHSKLEKGQRLVVDHIAVMQKGSKARTLRALERLEQ